MERQKKAIIIGLDERQKKMLRVLLRHQENICQIKENRRRRNYQR